LGKQSRTNFFAVAYRLLQLCVRGCRFFTVTIRISFCGALLLLRVVPVSLRVVAVSFGIRLSACSLLQLRVRSRGICAVTAGFGFGCLLLPLCGVAISFGAGLRAGSLQRCRLGIKVVAVRFATSALCFRSVGFGACAALRFIVRPIVSGGFALRSRAAFVSETLFVDMLHGNFTRVFSLFHHFA
jgi:hypothetical protein